MGSWLGPWELLLTDIVCGNSLRPQLYKKVVRQPGRYPDQSRTYMSGSPPTGDSLCICFGIPEELVLSFQHVGSEAWRRGLQAWGKCLYSPSHLICPGFKGWRADLGIKRTCCSWRGPRLSSQHSQGNFKSSGSDTLFWHPRVLHVCSASSVHAGVNTLRIK